MDDLLKKVTGHDATLTFGFKACTQYCPFINGVLAALDDKAPGRFKHIVIATIPETDGKDTASREAFRKTVIAMMNAYKSNQKAGIDPQNLMILYPPDHDTAVKIQIAFDNIVGSDMKTHTANVSVFGKTGQRIAKAVPPDIPTIKRDGSEILEKKAQEFANKVLAQVNGKGL